MVFKVHQLVVESSHGEIVPDEFLDYADKADYEEWILSKDRQESNPYSSSCLTQSVSRAAWSARDVSPLQQG